MKNYTTGGIIVPALLIMLCSCAGSRINSNSPITSNGNSTESSRRANDNTYLNDIHIRAVRHFEKHYPAVPDKKWFVITNGFMVKYKDGDVPVRVDYDIRGNWLYAIRYYGEKKMPHAVRALVKGTWYDYTITGVEEIQQVGLPIYIVHMHEGDDWRMVQVQDGEMKEIIMPGKPGSKMAGE